MNLKWVKGSCRVSLSGEADNFWWCALKPLCIILRNSLWGSVVPFEERSLRWCTSLQCDPFIITSRAKLLSLFKYDGFVLLYSPWVPQQQSLPLIVFYLNAILADEGYDGTIWKRGRISFKEKFDRQATKSERFKLLSGQTGENNCTDSSALSVCHLGRVECSRAYHKCSAALQGGSKHSLSDSEAGTEQSPASHQSWQGRMAVWPLLMVEGGGDGRGWRQKGAAKRPKGH